MQTARVTFLTTPDRKTQLERDAARLGLSSGEYIRDALDSFADVSADQEAELQTLASQVNEAVPHMAATLDRINAKLECLHSEMDVFFKERGLRS